MISTRLRELRKERGLTQQQVANILSISARGYTYYELGKNEPSISTLNKLCDLFECSLDYLVGREDDFGNISIKNPTAELTAEEKNLIKIYRQLNMKNKIHVETYAQIRLDEQDPSEQKNPHGVYTTGRR